MKFAQVGLPGPGGRLLRPGRRADERDVRRHGDVSALSAPLRASRRRKRQRLIDKQAARHRGIPQRRDLRPAAVLRARRRVVQASAGRSGLSELAQVYWIRFLARAAVFRDDLAGLPDLRGVPRRSPGAGDRRRRSSSRRCRRTSSTRSTPTSSRRWPMTLALYLLTAWMHAPQPSIALAAATGLAASAALLVKYSNVGAVAIVRRRDRRPPRGAAALRRRRSPRCCCCAAMPVGLWMLRCHLVFGDWTALKDKYAHDPLDGRSRCRSRSSTRSSARSG